MKIFDEICVRLVLGSLTEPPRRLTGGFLHSMYSLSTPRGKFAVKLLNPNIMARPWAKDNFRRAEEIEARLEPTGIPILPALTFGGEKMQEINGQFFYVFDWFDGRALHSEEVREEHCRTIGGLLARIHGIARREVPFEREPIDIEWDYYADRLMEKNPALGRLVSQNADLLVEMQVMASLTGSKLSPVETICHSDMDCKNVLWNGSECRIIDLECLGWAHPHLELYETALCWSGIEQCNVNPKLFETFIRAYENEGGELPSRWLPVHDANAGRLDWLEYNIRRALGIDCSESEIALGESEIKKTIEQLVCYESLRDQWT